MDVEQKQRIEQIQEQLEMWCDSIDVVRPTPEELKEAIEYIDFLLSLVKNQEANDKDDDPLARFVLRQIRGCATDDQYIETLERVKTAFISVRQNATISTRSACVEKVVEAADIAKFNGNRTVETALRHLAKELESVSIQEQEK